MKCSKKISFLTVLFCLILTSFNSLQVKAQVKKHIVNDFAIKGFHLDLRIQVMKLSALKELVLKLSQGGINTLIMEYEATFPYEKHPVIANRYAYTKEELVDFIAYCTKLGIDVIPLQQSFGHLEYVLKNNRYKDMREDQKDFSQVCPSKEKLNKVFFKDLYEELETVHTSKYIHIGGDETHLLGNDAVCKARVEKEGVANLYGQHIKLLCDIVIGMGKIPVLWADIALKYPEAVKLLPKQAILVDWNYGWDVDKFGDHSKLMQSGFQIWGATSLRSSPDNYNFTSWEKHFNNIRDFIPAARKLNYKGMIMTSWSTSGVYSPIYESGYDIIDLIPIRRVYPLNAFNILLSAFFQGLKQEEALNTTEFVKSYCQQTYGLNSAQADDLFKALTAGSYEVGNAVVRGNKLTVDALTDTAALSLKVIKSIEPKKNQEEFKQYVLMADTRLQYLIYQRIEQKFNSPKTKKEDMLDDIALLSKVIAEIEEINKEYIKLNKDYFYSSELEKDNDLRIVKMKMLYNQLCKTR